MEEIWKPVKDFEGYYEVSNLGRVRSVDRIVYDTVRKCNRLLKGKVLTIRDNGHGYKGVMFCKEHKIYNKYVHRMVAETFIPNPNNLPCINHKDEDKSNNAASNLEWCTYLYNTTYGTGPQRRIQTNIDKGNFNPAHIGLERKELRRIHSREWREKHPGYWKKYVHK